MRNPISIPRSLALVCALALAAAPAVAGDPSKAKQPADAAVLLDALLAAPAAVPFGVKAHVACDGADGACSGAAVTRARGRDTPRRGRRAARAC